MSARLRVLTGPQVGQEVLVTGTATVGRLASCTLPIPIQAVSREHAKVYERDGDWFVVDLNSSNGTKVNGKKVTRQQLTDGDELELGEVKIRFIAGGGEEAAAGLEAGIPAEIGFDEPEVGLGGEPRVEPRIPAEIGFDEPEVGVGGEPRVEPRSPRQEPLAQIPDVLGVPDIEVRARPREQTGPAGGRTAAAAPGADFVVKDRILQYSKVPDRKGLLTEDISQRGLLFKAIAIVLLLAVCAGAFYLTMKVVASSGGTPSELDRGGEDEAIEGR